MNIDAAMTVGRPGMFATGQPKKEKLPVLVFCNGGCMDTSIGYENMLTDIAPTATWWWPSANCR